MTTGKPDDIPEDVWDAAEKAWEITAGGSDQRCAPMAAVRAAVLAEREACAQVADKLQYDLVARHIRKRGEG